LSLLLLRPDSFGPRRPRTPFGVPSPFVIPAAGHRLAATCPLVFPSLHRRISSQPIALSSLAIPPPGLPTGSKADRLIRGNRRSERLAPGPSGISLQAIWQKH
jgi:hypothetical protein